MAKAIILEKNLNNDLWPKLIMTITYIKNIYPIKTLENNYTPFNTQYKKDPDIIHLWILGSTLYVFLHKEKQGLKLEK